MAARYRRPVTLYLTPAAREALEERAERESRTVSKMGELLLADALVSGRPPRGGPATTGARVSTRSAPVVQKPAAARSRTCPHRIPPDAYCAHCDD